MGQGGLERIELLSKLPPERLKTLEQQCRWHQFPANTQIVDQSGENSDVFFVVEGTVRLVNFSLSGREIAFATVQAGDYFGELASIDGKARQTTSIAAEKCRLAALSKDVFRQLLEDYPELAMAVMARLAEAIRNSDDRIIDLCTLPAPQRVYAELMRMSQPDDVAPGQWVIRPMQTHAQIASRANTTRETVTRALGYLVTSGIVERVSKSLYIRDRETLANLTKSGDGEDALPT